jgi:small subunit ribosomal protein S9
MEKTTKKTTKKATVAVKKEPTKKAVVAVKKTTKTAKEVTPKTTPATTKKALVSAKKEPVVKEVQKKVVTSKKEAPKAPSTERKTVKKTTASTLLSHGVGRRKAAVARVWVKSGSGSVKVNEKDLAVYFDTQKTRLCASEPFHLIKESRNYDVVVNVKGGGTPGQAGAVSLGVARALLSINEAWRIALRGAGLLTVDARVKERKKYGQRGARRKFQFVKR